MDATPQYRAIARKWPRVTHAIEETYGVNQSWTITTGRRHNLCGYMLWALDNFTARCHEIWPDNPPSHAAMDFAAAREIRYHWNHQTKFRSPFHALAKCLENLPAERPERIAYARRMCPCQPADAVLDYQHSADEPSTETPLRSGGWNRSSIAPTRIGFVLPALTPPNSTQYLNQAPTQPGRNSTAGSSAKA